MARDVCTTVTESFKLHCTNKHRTERAEGEATQTITVGIYTNTSSAKNLCTICKSVGTMKIILRPSMKEQKKNHLSFTMGKARASKYSLH
jgi:hypothetical protein